MQQQEIQRAAEILWQAWRDGQQIDLLPQSCRPADRTQGYAVQSALAALSTQSVYGWKIAATSSAGQKHIGVDGPLAGRLLDDRILKPGTPVPMRGNSMAVAEAEFAFRLGRDLPARESPYSENEVMDAVDAAYPAIEIPDSRFSNFAAAGTAQLIADVACASWFIPGEAFPDDWRHTDLAAHTVDGYRNDERVAQGKGANVLGGPGVALAWIANELCTYGQPLRTGQVITTGTCVVPFTIASGDRIAVDFGALGRLEATME